MCWLHLYRRGMCALNVLHVWLFLGGILLMGAREAGRKRISLRSETTLRGSMPDMSESARFQGGLGPNLLILRNPVLNNGENGEWRPLSGI